MTKEYNRGDWVGSYEDFRDNTLLWIEDLAKLKKGWNSYYADPPSHVAINTAKWTVKSFFDERFPPTRIAPSAVGGIGITWKNGIDSESPDSPRRKAYIEVYNDGKIFFMGSDGIGKPEIIEISDKSVEEVITSVREYMNEPV